MLNSFLPSYSCTNTSDSDDNVRVENPSHISSPPAAQDNTQEGIDGMEDIMDVFLDSFHQFEHDPWHGQDDDSNVGSSSMMLAQPEISHKDIIEPYLDPQELSVNFNLFA